MALLAVHISEGVLSPAWWAGGMVLTVLLAVIGAWRIRDEEIPRIALLTAVFFVASLVQVPIPTAPTHAHLLFNGLLGVLLGWRAALAIPVGVVLQTVLFHQGNLSTLGINTCLMTIPAIAASYLFAFLRRIPWVRRPWFRSILVGVSAVVWVLTLVGLIANLTWFARGDYDDRMSGLDILLHPLTFASALLVAVIAAWMERKIDHSPDFAAGLLVGELTVLASVSLSCLVLLQGGDADWTYPALLEVLFHLPIAVIEGVVLGFTVGFLARVKPEMLGKLETGNQKLEGAEKKVRERGSELPAKTVVAGVGLLLLLGFPTVAQAHRLEGEYKILPGQRIRIESWFDLTGDSPIGAIVRAYRPGGEVLTEGKLDEKGFYLFTFPRAETLRVVISAGAGHRKELVVTESELTQFVDAARKDDSASPARIADGSGDAVIPGSDRKSGVGLTDALVGVSFILSVAAFVLGWRNAREIRKMRGQGKG